MTTGTAVSMHYTPTQLAKMLLAGHRLEVGQYINHQQLHTADRKILEEQIISEYKILKAESDKMLTGMVSADTYASKAEMAKPAADKAKVSVFKEGTVVTLDGYFKVESGIYKMLDRNLRKAQNTLLLGPTGVGKTELVSMMASNLGLPLTIFDMGTMSDPIMSLVGTHAIKVEGGVTYSKFARSRFSEVIQQPGVVLLDELSRASATANNLLFPCLDFRRELAMEYSFDDPTPVKVHHQCVFVATANLGSQYTGTHKLDRALLDRFMVLEIDPVNQDQLNEILHAYRPAVTEKDLKTITDIYININKEHDEFKISFNLSMRHLKMVTDLVSDGFTIYDAYYAICKGMGGKDGLKAIETILSSKETV